MRRRSQVQYRQHGGQRKDVPDSIYTQKPRPQPRPTFPAGHMPAPEYRDDAIAVVLFRMAGKDHAGFQVFEFEITEGIYGNPVQSVRQPALRFVSKTGKLIGKPGPRRYAPWIEDAHAAWVEAGKPATFEHVISK